MKRLLISVAISAALVAPLACDFESITAEEVMVGTLLSTPEVQVSPGAAAGVDGGFYGADGGEAMLTIPAQTAALVFFGTREGEGTSAPSPLSNASVVLQPQGGAPVTLTADGVGLYSRTSQGEGELKYQEGATYDFVVTHNGERYVGRVDNAPAQEKVQALHPPEGVVRLNANQSLTLNRKPLGPGETRTVGFVSVFPISSDGQRGSATYTTVPATPLEFLAVVAFPQDWQKDPVVIPGTAFPAKDQTYLVVFQTVRTGGPETSNLWFGSALLAGTADVGVIQTNP